MMFIRKIMLMAHNVKKTSGDPNIIHGEYASILKMNVMMCFVWFSHRSLHETHNKQNKGEDRGMIVS
jgi:hypothetical protein